MLTTEHIVNISKCFGITKDPSTQDFMTIMQHYNNGDLIKYITNNGFNNIKWTEKLQYLDGIAYGLDNMHKKDIVHKDLHSGNILIGNINESIESFIGDLGLSKSALEDNDNETYGIIPYVAPEILQ